jgi:hypothetical protein
LKATELIDFWFNKVMRGNDTAVVADADANAAIRQVFQGRLDGGSG